MQTQRIEFTNRDGHTLKGLIDWPNGVGGDYRAMALFAHCFTCTKNIKAASNISQALAAEGIAVMRFDFTGLGESEGEFAATTFSGNVTDLIDATRWLDDAHRAPALLIGHSLGGTAVLQAAGEIPAAVAVVTIGSPSTPEHVAHLFKDAAADIERDGEAEVLLAGRPFTIRKRFVDDLAKHPIAESVKRLRKALLVMHSPVDAQVEINNASELFAAAMHPKSFVSLDKADHLLSNSVDSRYAGKVLAGWAARYLPEVAKQADQIADGTTSASTSAQGFLTRINANGHHILADEPADVGGNDAGPSPYDLLSAALASCTTMTLQMYARHKKLPLELARATVRHDKIHAEDCESCESKNGKIDRFTREIEIVGDFDEPTRARFLEIADRCPVHKTLHGEIIVESTLVESDTQTS